MSLCERIRSLREISGLSQREVGELLGLSQSGYSKYETGENVLSADIVRKLAIIYDVSGDYIMDLTNEMRAYHRCCPSDMVYRDRYLGMLWKKRIDGHHYCKQVDVYKKK